MKGIDIFTIGQVSEMFTIPVSTLRYYDKEGLFSNLKRAGNSLFPASGLAAWAAPLGCTC
ncbi:MerR family DNA-binding transcriptional regulator [Slackia isoflavoniconvertens]|uniref:MerR family DNA-binding transcriptional regulator n=1 Tax=Slackia isoflavoniconvertens TaxID=572010 RepID=UPI003FD7C1F5